MGLLNVRNLRKAKDLLEKNRHKVGDVVEKAGDTLDKVSNGKTAPVTAKASDAARKYSQGATPQYGTEFSVDDETRRSVAAHDSADANHGQSQAAETAANAVKGAADALTNMMNKAAAHAEKTNDAKTRGADTPESGAAKQP